jgi:Arc/MetJ family transcription regulator
MTDRSKSAADRDRQLRLRAALRHNLKRRKAQAKARETGTESTKRALDSARIGAEKHET